MPDVPFKISDVEIRVDLHRCRMSCYVYEKKGGAGVSPTLNHLMPDVPFKISDGKIRVDLHRCRMSCYGGASGSGRTVSTHSLIVNN